MEVETRYLMVIGTRNIIGKVQSDIRKYKSIKREVVDHRKIWSRYIFGRDKEYHILKLKLIGSALDLNLLVEVIYVHDVVFIGLEYSK